MNIIMNLDLYLDGIGLGFRPKFGSMFGVGLILKHIETFK